MKGKDNWFVSMGSGQDIADPLLGFVRAAFWGDEPPNRHDGMFCAMLVLKLACEMSPGAVDEPIRMAILERDKKSGEFMARHLSDEEMAEHEEHYDEFMSYVKNFKRQVSPDQQPPIFA